MFQTIKVQDLALLAVLHEVAADRRVALLMMGAMLGQSDDADRDQLHADFLSRAENAFGGGPASFLPQGREAAIVMLGKMPA